MDLNLLIGPLVVVGKHPGGFVEDGHVNWPEGDRHPIPIHRFGRSCHRLADGDIKTFSGSVSSATDRERFALISSRNRLSNSPKSLPHGLNRSTTCLDACNLDTSLCVTLRPKTQCLFRRIRGFEGSFSVLQLAFLFQAQGACGTMPGLSGKIGRGAVAGSHCLRPRPGPVRPALAVANPIYREVIPRELTSDVQETVTEEPAWYVSKGAGCSPRSC